MRKIAAPVSGLAALILSSAAIAGFDTPPEIRIVELDREVRICVEADGDIPCNDVAGAEDGLFSEIVDLAVSGNQGSEARASAWQSTEVSTFTVRGQVGVNGLARLSESQHKGLPPGARSTAGSTLNIQFTVPVDTEYSLSGQISASGTFAPGGATPPSCLASGSVGFTGTSSDDQLIFQNASFCELQGEPDFLFTGTVKAGATLILGVSADFLAQEDDQIILPGSGTATVTFNLDFGDRDADGLLDDWEENGIDFSGPGIEIDLPALGADPDHKDVFVELDVMEGVPFGAGQQQALALVERVFADAPVFGNPDDRRGINLHVIYDAGARVPFESLTGADLDALFDRLTAIKANHFGNPGESAEIREARSRVFRYGLWADTITENGEAITGAGELRGDDFVVAAGQVHDTFSISEIARLEDYALAGGFMHELGHTLGLDHGGQDPINFKPHYLSVMNYAYQFPYDVALDGGGNVAQSFVVGYSDYELAAAETPTLPLLLSEDSLRELQVIIPQAFPGGFPAGTVERLAGRFMIWNAASQLDNPPVRRVIGRVLGTKDWNDNGTLESGTIPALDLTRADTATPVAFDQNLRGNVDYQQLRLPLFGPNFGVETPPAQQQYRGGMRFSQLDTILQTPVTNRIEPGDTVFRSGYEFTPALSESGL